MITETIASLVFDSWMEPIPELRSESSEDRHLIYEGCGLILDLLLKQAKDRAYLHIGGQVLPHDDSSDVSNLTIVIDHGGQRSTTRTNALGEFMFHAVPNGCLDLSIVLGEHQFLVRGLDSSEPRKWKVFLAAAGEAS